MNADTAPQSSAFNPASALLAKDSYASDLASLVAFLTEFKADLKELRNRTMKSSQAT